MPSSKYSSLRGQSPELPPLAAAAEAALARAATESIAGASTERIYSTTRTRTPRSPTTRHRWPRTPRGRRSSSTVAAVPGAIVVITAPPTLLSWLMRAVNLRRTPRSGVTRLHLGATTRRVLRPAGSRHLLVEAAQRPPLAITFPGWARPSTRMVSHWSRAVVAGVATPSCGRTVPGRFHRSSLASASTAWPTTMSTCNAPSHRSATIVTA